MFGIIAGDNQISIWGLSPAERQRRILGRVGVEPVEAAAPVAADADLVILGTDHVLETAFVRALAQMDPVIVVDEDGRPVVARTTGAHRDAVLARFASDTSDTDDASSAELPPEKGVAELGGVYQSELRKTTTTLFYALDRIEPGKIEWQLYIGAYKGVTDVLTKYVWPVPAFWLTRAAQILGLSPNFVTTISLVLVLLASYLFWMGEFGLGVSCAWGMCVLDTVDGKLARVTVCSSRWGEVYDHGIDLVHPPFWYAAWAYGLLMSGALPQQDIILHLSIIVGGYIVGRAAEGLFMLITDKLEMWVWHPLDSRFRLIVSRRNPNLAILTVGLLMGRPELGFIGVSVWTVISVFYQMVRIGCATGFRAMGMPIKSWLVP